MVSDIEIMIEKYTETRPPLQNHLSESALTTVGTMAVLTKRTTVSLNATERL